MTLNERFRSRGELPPCVEGHRNPLLHGCAGQSLLETVLVMPLVIVLAANAVSIGYVICAYLNLTAASRQGVAYSVRGTSSFLQTTVPSATATATLVRNNVAGSTSPTANAVTRVCTLALGLSGSGTSQIPNCETSDGSTTFPDPPPDPEAPLLVLHRVDVKYTITVPLAGSPFNVLPDTLVIHRSVMMRAMP